MMNSKQSTLYIVCTEFQLLTVLNLYQDSDKEADILFLTKDLVRWRLLVSRLYKIGIFKNIFISDVNTYAKIELIQDKLVFFDNVSFTINSYNDIFVTNFEFLKNNSVMINKNSIKINLFDEGTMSYLNYFVIECNRITPCTDIYLYNPSLANYADDSSYIIYDIHKISNADTKLIELYNYIFDYKPIICESHKLDIFFSQPFSKEISQKAKIRRFFRLFQNKSTHEYIESDIAYYQDYIIGVLKSKLSTFKRKKHPRELNSNNCDLMIDYPWELFLLNNPDISIWQYSLYSSVLCSQLILKESYNIKSLYLYPYVVENLQKKYNVENSKVINELIQFFSKIEKMGYLVAIKDINQLGDIIHERV